MLNPNIRITLLSGICIPQIVLKENANERNNTFGQFKAKVAIEGIKGIKTLSELATESDLKSRTCILSLMF
jgi:hypothetical protein